MAANSNGSEPSDHDLLAVARNGDSAARREAATARLLSRYRQRVYAWCFRMVRDHERAQELSQDVLLNAWRGLDGFAGRARFSSWLFALARNRCLSDLRRQAPVFDGQVTLEGLADEREDPERELLARIDEEDLLALIGAELDRREQDALWLRCVEGWPVDAITEALQVREVSGARGLLQRARRKLRAALAHRLQEREGEAT